MGMDSRLALLAQRDVADERHQFDLLVDRNLLVGLLLQLEEAQRHPLECADRRQVSPAELLLGREAQQSGNDLFSRLEDQYKGSVPAAVYDCRFHSRDAPLSGCSCRGADGSAVRYRA